MCVSDPLLKPYAFVLLKFRHCLEQQEQEQQQQQPSKKSLSTYNYPVTPHPPATFYALLNHHPPPATNFFNVPWLGGWNFFAKLRQSSSSSWPEFEPYFQCFSPTHHPLNKQTQIMGTVTNFIKCLQVLTNVNKC